MVDLNKAYLMDGQHVLSQEHMAVAQEIAHRYDNLRLLWIPPVDRVPGTDDKPFAIRDIQTNHIIKRFPETMVHLIPRWLYENDSQRTDTFAEFQKQEALTKKRKEQEIEEKHAPILDLNHSILKSNLHTYKHNGIRYGDSGIERIN